MDGFLTRAVAAVLSISSVICSSVFCVRNGDKLITAADDIRAVVISAAQTDYDIAQNTIDESTISQAPSSAPTQNTETLSSAVSSSEPESSTSSKAVAAAANSKKLGNIYSQFFSPYTTANAKYKDVYVNNKSGVELNIKNLLKNYSLKIDTDSKDPQVLIVHTHATENYATKAKYYTKEDMARTGEESRNVIGVGSEVERVLKKAGIGVIHDKTLHDSPSYSGSYNRSYNTVSEYLKKYPSIKIVLDIHRDAIGDGDDLVKPVTKIDGKNAAQVMICVGSNTGSVDYYPNWEENLSFGLKLQQTMEILYPGLARALYVAYDRCWNQNLSTGSVIIEFGTNGNTFAEAKYSATLVGKALVALF